MQPDLISSLDSYLLMNDSEILYHTLNNKKEINKDILSFIHSTRGLQTYECLFLKKVNFLRNSFCFLNLDFHY